MATIGTAQMLRREIVDGGICVLTFDRPESGANVFDAATLRDLNSHLDFIEKEMSLTGIVITSAKKSIFIAGADLKTLLRQAQTGELRAFIADGQRVFNRLAALRIPTCAAIHGACAGGGYELALACDWRIASDDPATKIGLPETTLGLIPAWGGCTRLPQVIGAQKAAEVISKGKLHSAQEAKEIGLVDDIVPLNQLFDFARKKLGAGKRKRVSASDAQTLAAAGGNTAAARALEIIHGTASRSMEESMRLELEGIVELGQTDATQNLIRNFFLAEKYKKGTSRKPAEKIAHAAVVGAGVMGSGIAQWLSSRGVSVILRDVGSEQLNQGLARIEKTYADAVKRGIVTEENAREGRARVVASCAPVQMRDVQVVIEAASEKLEVKKKIFADLTEKAPQALILATNTSALPISDLAAETKTPERVIGLHFFNPVSRMKLVEVVAGEQTSDETIQRALSFVRQIGKLPVVVRDSPGFVVNRVLFPYLLDAAELFQNGLSSQEIDDAVLQWGMPMGPLRLIDEIGVDITLDIADTLARAYGRRDEAPQLLRQMQPAGMLGRKSGSGFYKYEGKTQRPNAELEKWRTNRAVSKDKVVERLMFLMVNEAAQCLEENVIAAPEDVDYGMILGTGFAPSRGGPLRFAEHFGIKPLVQEMERLAQSDQKFAPAEILKKHARNGTSFYEDTARSSA